VTEYAALGHRALSPYQSLAERTGRPLHEIVALAERRSLSELFGDDGRLIGQRLSGAEALRRMEQRRCPPGPLSHAQRRGILRAHMDIIDADAAAFEQTRRDPHQALAELRAKRLRWEQ
jgi:hypothetical protein